MNVNVKWGILFQLILLGNTNMSLSCLETECEPEQSDLESIKQRLESQLRQKMNDDLSRVQALHDVLIDRVDLRGIVLNAYLISEHVEAQQRLMREHRLLMGENRLLNKDVITYQLHALLKSLTRFRESNIQDYIRREINRYKPMATFDIMMVHQKLDCLRLSFEKDDEIRKVLDRFKTTHYISMGEDWGIHGRDNAILPHNQIEYVFYLMHRYTKTALRKCIRILEKRINGVHIPAAPSKPAEVLHLPQERVRPRPPALDFETITA